MTQRDHELMDVAEPDTTTSVPESPPPPRDSMEDADPSLTRKRPRLDSGSVESPATHNDRDTSVDTIAASEQLVEMTIRSQQLLSLHPPETPGDTGDAHNLVSPEQVSRTTAAMAAPSQAPSTPEDPPSRDPSSDDSPPVIAIDDDDDPEDMVAYAAGETIHVEYVADRYFGMFPYSNNYNYMPAVREITSYLHSNVAIEAEVLNQLTRWLDGLPIQPSSWGSFYVDQAAFWDEFATLVFKLLSRRAHFGDQFTDGSASEEDIITEFFCAYFRTVVRLTKIDATLLSQWSYTGFYDQPVLSHKHVRNLSLLLRQYVDQAYCHVLSMLRKEYQVDIDILQLRLMQVFIEAAGPKHLSDLTSHACGQLPLGPQNFLAVHAAMVLDSILCVTFALNSSIELPGRSDFLRDSLAFFRRYEATLQIPSKVADVAVTKDLIIHLTTLIFDVCQHDENIAAELIDQFLDFRDPESPTAASPEASLSSASYLQDPAEYPKLISSAWKFKLLRKYVVKGRMELRVMSIGFMNDCLVELWKDYSGTVQSIQHPVMQYLADFLLHERVVDYIISVDSHPQLISRSGNIVGFLVVTRRYSDALTDAIWNTVSHSCDPRVVSATMTMIRNIFGLMLPNDQYYLCSKLYELPIESYNVDIVRFLRELTQKLLGHDPKWAEQPASVHPWNTCVRIMQDTAPGREDNKLNTALHAEVCDQLRWLAPYLPTDERYQILRDCAAYVASRSPRATGSVRAIHILASATNYDDSYFFQENADIVRDVLEETCTFVRSDKDMAFSAEACALQYRLELLALLISGTSGAIPADLYQKIWDHLIGQYAHTNHLRDLAWSRFLDAMQRNPDNDFCKQLVTVCVPKLDPQYYTPGMYEFVAAYRFPIERRTITTKRGTKELMQICGADLLWSMIVLAPPQTIEDRAAKLLASRYLELNPAQGVDIDELEEVHVALVEQCMDELLSAFNSLRLSSTGNTEEGMDIDFPDLAKQQKERRFSRTVLFLKLLLGFVRSKPELNRARRADSKVEPLDIDLPRGEPVEIKYQHPATGIKHVITIGSENTLQDLHDKLCQAIGFSKLNLFAKGQRLNMLEKANEKIAALDLVQVLLVQKAPGADASRPVLDHNGGSSVFEATLLSYFDKLFACMDADDEISSVVYDFLSSFPYQNAILDPLTRGSASAKKLFLPSKPWQAKYAACALEYRVKAQVRKNSLDDEFLARAVQVLDQAILNPELKVEDLPYEPTLPLSSVLVGALLAFLKERPAKEVSAQYFSNARALVNRLYALAFAALEHSSTDFGHIAWQSYCLMVEASLHSQEFWQYFAGHDRVVSLHEILLLSDSRKPLRDAIARAISSVCGGSLPPSSAITERDTATSFWSIISSVLPRAIEFPSQSEQLFELADQVFRKHDEHNRDEASLRLSLTTWSDLLLRYHHEEKVGRDEIDHVVMGLTKLLLNCVSSLKSFKKPLNAGQLVKKIWTKFLFAPRVVEINEQDCEPEIPVLESNTRKELYDLCLALAEDRTSYGALLALANDLELDDNEQTLQYYCVDRANEIRAPTGYVGLFNPRAICYMNSLITQLFMNVNFRKFILELNVTDPQGAQILLHQTQKLFAKMQNSFRKSADPRAFAVSVKVPEGTPIDINVQMDADEFYNLLFDQWEGQMLSPVTKERFRSFYGGHTVNQIKSKECEHVSERVESFFVVQCDVQGKHSLSESLQSFVEGDVMEGDNKYKCESCGGKLVDAVKRTCLKDVPDNLIFHLKRFDFDLVELRRAKINDHFEFPSCIDISQFTIDHLSDPSKPRQEDFFDLVGVLVHQGTSENGHYYSYIRERPSPTGNMSQWVEFNDRDVDAFEYNTLPYHAFGGFYDDNFTRQQKQFSAYMLFYQRRAAIEKDHNEYMGNPQSGIAKVPVPVALDERIQMDNDVFIREYSLHDPNHTKFVRQLLANLRTINAGTCSEDHQQENGALQVVLEHLCSTLFRGKTADLVDEVILQLRKSVLACATCCHATLTWLSTHPWAMSNILLQSAHLKVRAQSRSFLIDSLQSLRQDDPVAYGIETVESDGESSPGIQSDGVLAAITKSLRRVCDDLHLSARGWDDFFLVLCQLSEMGHIESAALLDHGFLEFCLRVFCIEVCRTDSEIWRIVEKKKRIYNRMVEFVYRLLNKMDVRLPLLPNRRHPRLESYERNGSKFAFTQEEKRLLYWWHEDNKALAFLDKMLELFDPAKTEIFYPGEIIKIMLDTASPSVQQHLFYTVHEGICQLQPSSSSNPAHSSDPYVRAAVSYCEACPDKTSVDRVIDAVGKQMIKYKENGGEVNVHFMRGLLNAKNEEIFDSFGNDYYYTQSLILAKRAGTCMLQYLDDTVRKNTATHLETLFIEYTDENEVPEDVLKVKYKVIRSLINEQIDIIVDDFGHYTSWSYIEPLVRICEMLVKLLQDLHESQDPALASCKSLSDWSIIDKFETHVLHRIQDWPMPESEPNSTGEPYDPSDYGTESDVDLGHLDL